MDLLQGMKVFVRVAQRSGFAAAARDLRMSPGAVTKNVAALEAHLGTRLFDRNDEGLIATATGDDLAAAAVRVEEEIHVTERRFWKTLERKHRLGPTRGNLHHLNPA